MKIGAVSSSDLYNSKFGPPNLTGRVTKNHPIYNVLSDKEIFWRSRSNDKTPYNGPSYLKFKSSSSLPKNIMKKSTKFWKFPSGQDDNLYFA